MQNVKKILLVLLFVSCLASSVKAEEEKKSSLYYLKLGAVQPPGDSSCVLPTLGLGARFQNGYHGFDLSLNLSSIIFINYASLKGVFLFYPYPEKNHQLYYGVGPGIGYHIESLPMGQPYGCASNEGGSVTLEGVVGYEFRHSEHFKTFIQLELSQPIFRIGGRSSKYTYKPGIAISAGIGF